MFTINEKFVVIDTETANTYTDEKGKTDMSDVLCYDIGFAVVDKNGYVYEAYSFCVDEIFNSDLMETAYFRNKLPQYYEDIASGSRVVKSIMDIWATFKEVCDRYHVRIVSAHNARFDARSLNNTLRYLSGSQYRHFLPDNVTWWDTMKLANKVLGDDNEYWLFCEYYECMTTHKKPRPSYSAENIYRYISNNPEFIESHTGLEDVMIEKDILVYCLYMEPDINGKLWND